MLSPPDAKTWRQTLYPGDGQPFCDWQVRLLMVLATSGMDATWPTQLDPFTVELDDVTLLGPGGDDTCFARLRFTWAELRNTLNTNLATTTCEDMSVPYAVASECWWNWSLALSETIAPRTRTGAHLLVALVNGEPQPAGYSDLAGNPVPEPPRWED